MKFILSICVLHVIICGVYGAVGRIPPDTTPGHPGHCNSEKTGPMNKGEKKSLMESCASAICESDGTILLVSCGAVGSPCGKTDLDLTKPYPDCCPKPKECKI